MGKTAVGAINYILQLLECKKTMIVLQWKKIRYVCMHVCMCAHVCVSMCVCARMCMPACVTPVRAMTGDSEDVPCCARAASCCLRPHPYCWLLNNRA